MEGGTDGVPCPENPGKIGGKNPGKNPGKKSGEKGVKDAPLTVFDATRR
jgi:hypothetical protein